jgi:A/G-specific adenine glycosylase
LNIEKLETWYIKNHRKLPFRETKDPYHIWVSEVMLQQTQVDTVIPYFKRFIKTFPTVNHLAKTDEETLFNLIQGLGYYRRFKNMHQAAQMIVDQYQGIFPSTYDEIIKLPGIGAYSVGAIMSIAFNQPVSATDGNVIRVLSRLYDIEKDMRLTKHNNEISQLNQSLIINAHPHVYTQAMMELGALICKPKQPLCDACPLKQTCKAYELGKVDQLPILSKKPKKKTHRFKTFIIRHNDVVYLRKRTEKLLGGMYEFPQFSGDIPFNFKPIKDIGHVKHIFTHLIWEMDVIEVELVSKPLDEWVPISLAELNQYPMSTAHKKVYYILMK